MMFNPRKTTKKLIIIRTLIAVIGGYIGANLLAIVFSLILPGSQVEGVGFGMLMSFLFYALLVMWVFVVETAKKAFLGIVIIGCSCSAIIAAYRVIFS